MKHHEYQIYYGGIKEKLPRIAYCKTCGAIVRSPSHKTVLFISTILKDVPSHKKQTAKPRQYSKLTGKVYNTVIPKKN